ncbi:MAG TPA: M3 family metallopeptidase, partial [Candidatus Baltobacteraceae bacterium]|nr:M3 family metallopeptidase [Candidatus Baltobacteraceae bacterium]
MNRLLATFGGALLSSLTALTVYAGAQQLPAAVTTINWNLTAAQIGSTCGIAIATATKREQAIIRQPARPTFQSVVVPLENLNSDLNDQTVAQTFLFAVGGTKDVRDAALKCNSSESAFYTTLTASPALYAKVAAAERSRTARTVYDRKLTDLWLDTFKRSGASLPPDRRAQFVKYSNQLTDLENRYQSNLAEDQTSITITAAQAASLPADFVAGLKQQAGSYVVPVNESTVSQFLANERDESARKTYYMAISNQEAVANTSLLEQAIAVRDHLAHLLGYQTWAAYRLSDRMAKSPARVMSFLNSLDARILPAARDEVAVLTALKSKETGEPNATLRPWDVAYYDSMLSKTKYAVDQNRVRQYFPVQHTIDAVLNI